jgi:hypothetical protein
LPRTGGAPSALSLSHSKAWSGVNISKLHGPDITSRAPSPEVQEQRAGVLRNCLQCGEDLRSPSSERDNQTSIRRQVIMAVLRKGSRQIEVAGHRLLWRIRRKGTYAQSNAWTPMTIAVAAASGRGSKLVLELDISRPDAWINPSNGSVTPADVAHLVSKALSDGWQPELNGKPVVKKVTLRRADTATA